jgi:hypothetical protein
LKHQRFYTEGFDQLENMLQNDHEFQKINNISQRNELNSPICEDGAFDTIHKISAEISPSPNLKLTDSPQISSKYCSCIEVQNEHKNSLIQTPKRKTEIVNSGEYFTMIKSQKLLEEKKAQEEQKVKSLERILKVISTRKIQRQIKVGSELLIIS